MLWQTCIITLSNRSKLKKKINSKLYFAIKSMDICGILFPYLLENLYRDLYIFFLNDEKIEYNQNEILTNIRIKKIIDIKYLLMKSRMHLL